MPPAVASLLAALPPARVYDGPLMDVEAVMDTIMQWEGDHGAAWCGGDVVSRPAQRGGPSGGWTRTRGRGWTCSRHESGVLGDLLDLLIDVVVA